MEKQIPTLFKAYPEGNFEQVTPLISKGKLSIFYKYKNRNKGYITDEFAEKLISTLPYVPVVGIYDEDKGDFLSHNRDRNVARIYGLVPENPNGQWMTKVDDDGVERTYYVVDVYLYTGRLDDANKIIGNPQSLELDIDSIKGAWMPIDGEEYFVYTDAHFIGLSVLGKDVKPCFEGSAFFDLLTQFGEYFSQSNLVKVDDIKEFNEGGTEQVDLTNFKFSTDEKIDSIWKALNPDFAKDEQLKIEKIPCEIGSDFAIVTTVENTTYEKYSFVTKDDGTIEILGEPEIIYNTWMNQKEKSDFDKLTETCGDFSNAVDKFEEFENEISDLKKSCKEKEDKFVELENEKATYELDAKTKLEEAQNQYNALKADFEVLKNEHDARILEAKESKIEEYSDILSDSSLDEIKEKVADFSLEELEKELLFAVKKEKPSMFSKKPEVQKSPTSIVNETGEVGLVGILKKYKH